MKIVKWILGLLAAIGGIIAIIFGSSKSKIIATGNTVDAKVDGSKIKESNIGMTIKSNGSTITAKNNKVKAEITGSTVINSNVGLNIVAEKR